MSAGQAPKRWLRRVLRCWWLRVRISQLRTLACQPRRMVGVAQADAALQQQLIEARLAELHCELYTLEMQR